MNYGAVVGLIQRRGQVMQWSHAMAVDPSTLNPNTGNRQMSAGASPVDRGTLQEQYYPPVNVRAYFSKKMASINWQSVGGLDADDAQLDVSACFEPEPFYGIMPLPPLLLAAWNSGAFVSMPRNGPIQRDRFIISMAPGIANARWVVKAPAVPLADDNTVFVWRLLIGKDGT
jgi:hypothetical protein